MYEYALVWEWMAFAVRWLHVVTAIAWIGSSFYFIALDLGLRRAPDLPEGAHDEEWQGEQWRGEQWQIHGGDLYQIRRFGVAPAEMPEHLTWFRWESYATWLSGATLLAIVYWAGAELFLIDPAKADLAPWQAIALSATSLVLGWVVYDRLCKSPLGEHPATLMPLLFALLVATGWSYSQIFTGRAMMLHMGAFAATIMTANIAHIIIPSQRIIVADLRAGRKPDPKYGRTARLRATHNNYLTLPVIFLMLSNHYPLAFATEYNWLIAALVFLMGVVIRHGFNTRHARAGNPRWTWLAAVVLFALIVWLSSLAPRDHEPGATQNMRPGHSRFAEAAGFKEAVQLVQGRCSLCHGQEPAWEGMIVPPRGVILESEAEIAARARDIYLQAGRSHAMPPPFTAKFGITLSVQERKLLVNWYENALSGS
ncbi:MAG: urate hydroxylase PuuD [Nitratireductor sp.]|nr:urate hydroxylase PuuD [Nitratireductor sp.]